MDDPYSLAHAGSFSRRNSAYWRRSGLMKPDQDALRRAIATRRGYCSWTVDHAGWVVTLHSPDEQDFYGKTLEMALAWCLVWLMAPELGSWELDRFWPDRGAMTAQMASSVPGDQCGPGHHAQGRCSCARGWQNSHFIAGVSAIAPFHVRRWRLRIRCDAHGC